MSTEIFNCRDYLVTMNLEKLADRIATETGMPQLRQQMEVFQRKPFSEGLSVSLGPDASIYLFVPNMLFGTKYKLGSHIWVFFSKTQECVCLS